MRKLAKRIVVALCAFTAMVLTTAVAACAGAEKCAHDWGKTATQIVKDSTCMEKGEELWTCGKCGEEKIVKTEKKEHNLDDGIVAKEPTCTETGTMLYKCMTTDCTYTKTEKIEKTAHVRVDVEAVKATCTQAGASAYAYCQDCKTYIVPKTILSALGHQNKVLAGIAATCTTDGLTEGTQCVLCNEITKAQTVISATGHTEVIDAYVAPTCGGGLTQGSHCGKCGEILQEQTVIPGNNNHVNTATREAIAATCTSVGMTSGTYCLACGETLSGCEEIPKLSHNLVDGYCSVCGYHEHNIITQKAVAATCTTTGKTVGRYCDICGEVFAEQITTPALGHGETYQYGAVEATCTTNGYSAGQKCSRCDTIIKEPVLIPATGHNVVDDVCTICGENLHVHSYTMSITKRSLSCKVAGTKTYTCSCGDTYTEVYYADHKYVPNAHGGTTCEVCGVSTI